MEKLNLGSRPDLEHCNIPHLEEVNQRVEFFSTRSMLVTIGGNRPYTDPKQVLGAICGCFSLDPTNVSVARHQPEDFRVTFTYQEDFDRLANTNHFNNGGRQLMLRIWSTRKGASGTAYRFHVKLCLEGLPMHLCAEEFVAWAISRSCYVHHAEEYTIRRADTRSYDL